MGRSGGRTTPLVSGRTIAGLVLVVASVVGVWAVVDAGDDTVRVYTARHALAVGDTVTRGDLRATDADLGAAHGRYLTPTALHGGLVVRRAVAAGDLVPRDSVGAASGRDLARVVVRQTGTLPETVVAGAGVTLWAAQPAKAGDDEPAAPRVLVDGARVVRVVEQHGLGAVDGDSVELAIPSSRTSAVLQARADGAALSVVPGAGTLAEGTP